MGGFFASLLTGGALQTLVNTLLPAVVSLVNDYTQNKITKEQLAEKLQEAILSAFSQVEKQYLDSITKTYTAFIQAMMTNPEMVRAWKFVLYSQTIVLVWHQAGIPLFVQLVRWTYDPRFIYPSSGTTVEWAYALIALCLGAPAISSRIGPAASWASDAFNRLIKR